MPGLRVLNVVGQAFHLALASRHEARGDLVRARARLEKALALEAKPDRFMLAYDGKLMIREGNFDGAQSRHLECWDEGGHSTNRDDRFAALFSHVYLLILDENCPTESIREAALAANRAREDASDFVAMLLPSFPIGELEEILTDRPARL